MRKFGWVCLFVLCLSIVFQGCSSDDDSNDQNATNTGTTTETSTDTATETGTDTSTSTETSEDDEKMVLPSGYYEESIYRSKLAGIGRLAQSQNGKIFIKHESDSNTTRISLVDVEEESLTKVVDLKKSDVKTFIVGGPENSFLVGVGNEVRRYDPDGTYSVWGTYKSGTFLCYSPDGRLIGFDNDNIVQFSSDGSSQTLVAGKINIDDDVVVAKDGTLYVADIINGNISKVDSSGTRTQLAEISKDPCHIGLDSSGNLYVTNVPYGFVRVDTETGAFTYLSEDTNVCYVKCPADFVIDDNGRVVFATWTDNSMSWYDLNTKKGDALFTEDWTNTNAIDLGPDNNLYIGISGCGSTESSKVVRFSKKGTQEVFLSNVNGSIRELKIDTKGGVYLNVSKNEKVGIYYASGKDATLEKISFPENVEIGSFDIDPISGNLYARTMTDTGSETKVNIAEVNESGIINNYIITLPKVVTGINIMFAPDGKLFAHAEEKERWATGPVVERYIISIDLNSNAATVFSQIDLNHCCPLTNASIDGDGNIWWVLNPDFYLYKISSTGEETMFAKNIPMDTGAVFRTSDGDLLFNYPGGILRVYSVSQ